MFNRKEITEERIDKEEVMDHKVDLPDITMSELNNVVMEGHIVSDIRRKVTDKATVVNFKVLNRKVYKGLVYNSPFNVVCWNSIADLATDNLVKGDKVKIIGELSQEVWEGPYGPVQTIKIQAFRIMFGDKGVDNV